MGFMDYLEKRLSEKPPEKKSEEVKIIKEEKQEPTKKVLTIDEQIQERVNSLLESAGKIDAPKASKKSQEITDMINKILG